MSTLKERSAAVLAFLRASYPDAHCALHFRNDYECLFAIALSAQTTDASVNRATPALFAAYPDVEAMAKATPEEVRPYIASLGLSGTKAKNLVAASKAIVERFHSQIPTEIEDLTSLPGIGWKTANVYRLERLSIPAIPVDTHVHRLSARLGLAKEKDSLLEVQRKLERLFPKEDWHFVHLALITHGRVLCKAAHPLCEECGLSGVCPHFKKTSSIKGR